MATATMVPLRELEPAGGRKVRLVLGIDQDRYDVTPAAAGDWGGPCWRLAKHGRGGEVYDVWLTRGGLVACECGDYQHRKRGTTARCKHGDSLVGLGLIVPPNPGRE
jgi:hypothetical protein